MSAQTIAATFPPTSPTYRLRYRDELIKILPVSELRGFTQSNMRGLLSLALCSLLLSASFAHDVEDDFDDEAEVEVEAEDTVIVEKVTRD